MAKAKKIYFSKEAKGAVLAGINKVADAVKVTLGPQGRVVALKSFGHQPYLTKDGVTVAKAIALADEKENVGAQLIKDVASKAATQAGDGTTTATILAQYIAAEGIKATLIGHKPTDIKKGIDKTIKEVVKYLKTFAIPIKQEQSLEILKKIGCISANGDKEIGDKAAEAISIIGTNGVFSIEEANIEGISLEKNLGFKIKERGYVSPYFVTNTEKLTAEFTSPCILLADFNLHLGAEVLSNIVSEIVVNQNRPLIIIANKFENAVLSYLYGYATDRRYAKKICAILSPGVDDQQRKQYLEDIAAFTGAIPLDAPEGGKQLVFHANNVGTCEKIIVARDNTVIIGGKKAYYFDDYCNNLKEEIKESYMPWTKNQLEQRLANLTNSAVTVKVGGLTEAEIKEKKYRVEDALCACKAALEEGIVAGGGIALYNAALYYNDDEKTNGEFFSSLSNEEERIGAKIAIKALLVPIKQIIENAGGDSAEILYELKKTKIELKNNDTQTFYCTGFDAQNLEIVDMLKTGIVDPLKVVRVALEDAASVAGLIVTCEALVVDDVEANGESIAPMQMMPVLYQ